MDTEKMKNELLCFSNELHLFLIEKNKEGCYSEETLNSLEQFIFILRGRAKGKTEDDIIQETFEKN